MIEHVSDLLGAYVDGELHGLRLRQVEEHLSTCAVCRKELEELRSLSSLLQKSVPMEAFAPVDKFAANMVLRLAAQDKALAPGARVRRPERAEPVRSRKPLSLVWWLAPVGLLGAWVFAQGLFTLFSFLSTAEGAGLLGNVTAWFSTAPSQSLWFSATMGLFGGQLSGTSKTVLDVLNGITVTGVGLIIQLALQAGIALAYWAWLALWWRRQTTVQQPALTKMPLHS